MSETVSANDDIIELVRSHADGDDKKFYAIAMQIAAKAARLGHTQFAQELRDLVTELRRKTHHEAQLATIKTRGELESFATISYSDVRLNNMTLSPDNQKQLHNVVVEQRQRDKLMLYNLRPVQQLLFIGPSGTGKTLAAKALAGELNLPLISVRLDMPIGDAATKLRSIIDISQETRGVYLFNEVDAITADGGEARQAINLLLQFVEDDYLNNLIIVATNHPQSFGYATLRRFDQVIKFELPSGDEIRSVIENRLAVFTPMKASWETIVAAADGLSHADLAVAATNAVKRAVLNGKIGKSAGDFEEWTEYLCHELEERRKFGKGGGECRRGT